LTNPSFRRKKTVARAVRLTEDLDRSLQAEAESKGITVSSLISSIFTRYLAFDRPTEKVGMVHIIRKMFEHLLDAVSEEELRKSYPLIEEEWVSQIEFMTGQKATFDDFWKSLGDFGNYSGLYQYNASRSDLRFSLSLHHAFGKKWSDGLETIISDNLSRLGARTLSHSSTAQSVLISGETPVRSDRDPVQSQEGS
jgi:hypothetical protein